MLHKFSFTGLLKWRLKRGLLQNFKARFCKIESLLQFVFLVWIQKPTVTAIESMNNPIETLKFPTITLCPKNPNTDRWGPTIKAFDHMRQRCNLNK